MKKILFTLLILLVTTLTTQAYDDDLEILEEDSPEVIKLDVTREEISPDKEEFKKTEEESLFARIAKREYDDLNRADFLLADELTHKFDKGILDKVQFFGAYQGNLVETLRSDDHATNYEFGFMDLGATGQFKDKKTDFLVRLNFMPSDNLTFFQRLVTDAYIENRSIPHHKIIVGNSRNQNGVDAGMGAYLYPFANRSQIGRTFGNVRALGVRLVGDYSLADYSIAFNSSQRYWRNFFPGVEFTGWANLKPLGKTDGRYGKLTIGGGLNAGHNDINYMTTGFYVGYEYKKFMANFEYSYANGINAMRLSSDKAKGFYTSVGYNLTKKLQVLARYDQFDPNLDRGNDIRREYTAGINYFIKGTALLLMLNYVFCQDEKTDNSHRIVIGTQFLL